VIDLMSQVAVAGMEQAFMRREISCISSWSAEVIVSIIIETGSGFIKAIGDNNAIPS
jgi:hypothetical protein